MSLLINHFYRFGEFSLDTDQRILLREGKPVSLAPKVFDTLFTLVENAGRIVSKEELMNRVWPDTFVEEANLTYTIQQLRKTLGDDARHPVYIETVPKRGYRFIASVDEVLLDKGSINDQVNRRFETTESAVAGERLLEPSKEQRAVELASESEPDAIINRPNTATIAGSTGINKRMVATVGIVIILAGAALAVWQYAKGSSSASSHRTGTTASIVSPLNVEKLTASGTGRFVAISPDGRYIAYTQVVEKKRSIWLRQLRTNTNIEIVPPTGNEHIQGLQFSNSGEYLYFVKGYPSTLYRVSSLGGVPTKLLENLEEKFAVSPDDSQITFIRTLIKSDGQREQSLLIANDDGKQERVLLTTAHPDTLNVPIWSPDGASIICAYFSTASGTHGANLIEVRAVDGVKKELHSGSFFSISKMAWLPDKSALIMSARKTHEGENQLWRASYPGMEVSQITEGVTYYIDLSIASSVDKAAATQGNHTTHIWVGPGKEPETIRKILQGAIYFCWAPNGQLVYSSKAAGNVDLWVMQPDGGGQKQLTTNPEMDGTPAVTRDGRYIVFVSNRTGAYELWRMNMDGSGPIQLTKSGGIRPSISPDGKWVFYNSSDWRLWKVPIDGGEPVRLVEHVAQYPSISPDGRMIACMQRTEHDNKLSILVLPVEGGPPLKRIEFAQGGFRGVRISWTADNKALIFGIDRSGATALIKQRIDGGAPEELMNFDEDELFDFGYSADGRSIAVTRGEWQHDIVLIHDLLASVKNRP